MNLLLTSAGFTNKSICNAFFDLVTAKFNKPLKDLNLVFIPTAANADPGDKDWLLDDMKRTNDLGFKEFDVLDFTGVPKDIWEQRIRKAEILMFGGGNTFHLMYSIEKTGMRESLNEIISDKIYVGISAGSMIASENVALSQSARMYSESVGEITNDKGMGWVPFYIRPHLNSHHFPNVRIPQIEEQAKNLNGPVYALDDNSALVITDTETKVVSEGEWQLIKPHS